MKQIKNKIALLLALVMIFEVIAPVTSYALTSGPSQPEFNSFEPATTTQMVDLFTGDFTYNIPLMQVPGSHGGYPINLFYHSVTSVEEEASMVGLGWNVGVGAIKRNMRGLPDDFSGEKVKQLIDIKKNWTLGVNTAISGELLAFDAKKNNLGLGLSLSGSLSYNNYRGVGWSVGINPAIDLSERLRVSFGATYSNHDAISTNTGISLYKSAEKNARGSKIGGLTSTTNTITGSKAFNLVGNLHFKNKGKSGYTPGSITFTSDTPTYIPSYELPYSGLNLSLGFKGGVELFLADPYASVSGFYRSQSYDNNRQWTSSPAYGSLYLEEGQLNNNAVLDFNRIKDGPVSEYQTNLAVPFCTEDYFSLSGHGTGGVFKLHRNDIGFFRDKSVSSTTGGGSLVIEEAVGGIFKAGIDVELNYSLSQTGANTNSTDLVFGNDDFKFQPNSINNESKFFLLGNEMTAELNDTDAQDHKLYEDYEYLGKDDLMEFNVDKAGIFDRGELIGELSDEAGTVVNLQDGQRANKKPRGSTVQYFTNNDLSYAYPSGTFNNTHLSYKIPQFDIPGLVRPEDDKIGAFTVTDKSGIRWNYGLPVMNLKQQELVFSVEEESDLCTNSVDVVLKTSNADKNDPRSIQNKVDQLPGNMESNNYLKVTEIPEYAHAHLLTSILNDDYVDNDYFDGPPNNKDFGGWVNFTYLKASDFNWRVPFYGANYSPGLTDVSFDDTANIIFGTREQYYPETIETNSHKAVFTYLNREDNRGASYLLQNEVDPMTNSARSLKLDKIELYAKGASDVLIKTVNFKYSYALCPEVDNNLDSSNPNGGKLTLTEVSFTNYESNRASLNPYKFEYFNEETSSDYKYDLYNYDRWGVFKAHADGDRCRNVHQPYTQQVGEDLHQVQKENARAWHLKKIFLPSGSNIELDIERDDYAYVQNHKAMQMVKIEGIGEVGNNTFNETSGSPDLNYNKVFFKLNEPSNDPSVLEDYVEDLYEEYRTIDNEGAHEYKRQVYFKINTDLLKRNKYQYVDFAAYIKSYGLCTDQDCLDASGNSLYGFIELEDYKLELGLTQTLIGGDNMVHPFLLSSWQFIKSNLMKEFTELDNQIFPEGENEIFALLKKLSNLLPLVNQVRKNFYSKCDSENFAKDLSLENSFLRLNDPDRVKYGGGIRVKQVLVKDTWNDDLEETPVYGTVYNYRTIDEETGEEYSSGVAANEPIVGKEENAYYYMKRLRQDLKFNTDFFNFEQHPFNDNYFPSSVVGYSKVTVSSFGVKL